MTVLTPPGSREDLLERVVRSGIRFIDLQFTDIAGIVKSITIPAEQLAGALDNGVWFDGSAIDGMARVAESDLYLAPDIKTYSAMPWLSGEEATARIICNIHTPNGQPSLSDPRWSLKRVLDQAGEMGLIFNTSPEMEFFLLTSPEGGAPLPPIPCDMQGYFDMSTEKAASLRRQMAGALSAFGIAVESMHHEVANGQHEIQFQYAEAMRSADNAMTFRLVLKTIATRNGLYGTFMPKPMRDSAGSGMHVHQSLFYAKSQRNAFADSGDQHGLSRLAHQFMAGQLKHARALCAIVAPLVNSYKRLAAGYEAPVRVSWGRINRSALIRIPRAVRSERTRVELRCPDAACNPYLAFAAMLAAGLDGIRQQMEPPPATDEDLYALDRWGRETFEMLPETLKEALDALEEDAIIRDALGARIHDSFQSLKRQEWEDYSLDVSDWELDRYLQRY